MTTINLGLLLSDQVPEVFGLIQGYTQADRDIELLRLTLICPPRCTGYIDQLAYGTRSVRLDAARQLQRAGVEFKPNSIPHE